MCPAGDSSERSTSRVAERTPDPVVEDPDSTPRGWRIQDWDAKPVGGEDPDPIPGNEEGPKPDPNLAGGMDVAPSGDGRTDLSWRL